MEDKPRYSRTSDILELLILMQAKPLGISINDIMQNFNVSRRTAERMRDSILNICPQITEIENPRSREKFWGFNGGYLNEIISFTPDEIANLEKMKKYQEENGFEDKQKILEQTINKIKALGRKYSTKLDNALEILLETEGYAVKQVPKYKIDLKLLETVRSSMKSNKKIKAKYNGKNKVLSPYGLIYGEKIYLIGVEEEKGTNPYCYLLHKFSEVNMTDKVFDKGDFNLDEFSKKSFGVYQGECFDVKLLFSKNVAEDVLNYHFHSTQKLKRNEDGSVTVKFKASGDKEIMWHLFKWGEDVKILAPNVLKKEYVEILKQVLKKQEE